MNNNNFDVFINNNKLKINSKFNIIQACNFVNLEIPRFCYHEKLSIAGNCRMCLVEVAGSLKPVASCAMPILNNMKIFTNSILVKKAREGIIEFILLNHPLDCPICDQGGECDLQDQSLVFGNDRGRFYDFKRSVKDKNCGPLIKTIMTRCIHCTRCVRFLDEIAGIKYFGVIGRGSSMEISGFFDKFINSEVSSNIIDLCPVGALTSKPFSFIARPWELNNFNTIDLNDLMHVNIRIDLRDLKILRILPRINIKLNEFWISDVTRFFFDGVSNNRLLYPYYNKNKKFFSLNWLNFFLKIRDLFNNKKISFLFGNFIDAETCLLIKNFCNVYGNFSIVPNNFNNYNSSDFRFYFRFGLDLNFIKNLKNILLININLRLENPLFNIRIKNLVDKNLLKVFIIGTSYNLNFFSISKGNNYKFLINFLKGKSFLSNFIIKEDFFLCLINRNIFNFNVDFFLPGLLNYLNKYNKNFFFFFLVTNNTEALLYEFNLQNSINNFNDITLKKLSFFNFFLYCLNTDNFFLNFLNRDFFSIYQGHNVLDNFKNFFDFLLPTTCFLEKNASFINFFGLIQKSNFIIFPPKNSRSDFKIFSMLFRLFFKIKLKTFSNIRTFFIKYNFFNVKKIFLLNFDVFYKNIIKLYNINFISLNTNIYRMNQLIKSSKILFSCYKEGKKIYSNFI